MLTCAADKPNYDVAPGVSAALRNFKLPDKLGFGLVAAPVMFSAEWSEILGGSPPQGRSMAQTPFLGR